MLRIFLAAILCLSLLPGCSEDSCVANTGTYCDEGVVFWTDSCGELGEFKEDCACGCRADHTDCKKCECQCEQVNDCCDGCQPVNDADQCDDGDPTTEIDMCVAGLCQGFALQRTAPELPSGPADPDQAALESWACPAGWSVVQHATLTDPAGDPFSCCEPPDMPVVPRLKLGTYVTPLSPGEQDGDRPVCEPEVDGTFPVLGQAACQPLGDPCPAGQWPDIPPEVTGARVYVQAGSAGNGTQASPFGTITEGVNQAAGGDVVVIGAGIYPEMVAVNKNLTLWGKCVQQSVIDAPGPYVHYSDGAIMANGTAQVTVRNLQIGGGQNGVRLNSDNASALLEGVWIHGATREGVSQQVYGGSVTLRGSLIDSMQALSDGTMGWGIGTRQGCYVRVESSTIETARDVGIWSVANTIHLEDALIRNTLAKESNGTGGRGMELQTGAAATANRVLFDHNRDAGLVVLEASSIVLDEAVIFDTQPMQSTNFSGAGVVILQSNSSATFRRSRLIGNRDAGTMVSGTNAELILEDVLIADTLPIQQTGAHGNGIWAESGAVVTATRVLLDSNSNAGIMALSSGTTVDLTDVIVRNTVDDAPDHATHPGDGEGLWAEQGASITLTNGLLEANHGTGAMARSVGTTLTLSGSVVLENKSRVYDGQRGYCLDVSDGARGVVTGGLFSRCQGIGIFSTGGGSTLDLQDVTVENTQSEESSRGNGVGMWIDDAAAVTLARGRFEGNRTVGIYIMGSQTTADLEDIMVGLTLPEEVGNVLGRGMEIDTGAEVTVTRGWFYHNRDAGIVVGGAGSLLDATELKITDTLSRTEILVDVPEAGLAVLDGGHAIVTGGLFENNRTSSILATGIGATAELNGVTVRDTLAQEGLGVRGLGIWAALGAYVKVDNSLFERNQEVAVFAHAPGTRLEIERSVIKDTLTQEGTRKYGRGLNIQQGATGYLAYSLLDNNQSVGVFVHGEGSTVNVEEVLVANTISREDDRKKGHGFSAEGGGRAVLRSSVFLSNRDVNLYIHGQDTQVTIERVMIKDSLERDCATTPPITCTLCQCGVGLGIYHDATVTLDTVNVDTSVAAGVQLAYMGTLTGSNLILRNHPIAVNVQDVPADYDFFEEVTDLLMEDNAVNFDSTSLIIPDPVDTLGID
jgi:hypothetical protein